MIRIAAIIIFSFGIITGILLHRLTHPEFSIAYIGITLLFFISGGIVWYTINIKKQLDKAKEEIRTKSIIDEVTRVYDRKYFFEIFEKELDRTIRYKRKISCMLLDLDGFKKVNDTYGWQTGERILRIIASILKDSLRQSDIIARYGNDQFICILPETETEPALIIAKRLVALIGNAHFQSDLTNEKIKITASIGVTAWKPSLEKNFDAVGMIGMAEKAILLAKKEGGNRVDCYIV